MQYMLFMNKLLRNYRGKIKLKSSKLSIIPAQQITKEGDAEVFLKRFYFDPVA